MKDMEARKTLTWVACNKLGKIWNSNFNRELKLWLFRPTVESVMLYGSETWTTKEMARQLSGTYTHTHAENGTERQLAKPYYE